MKFLIYFIIILLLFGGCSPSIHENFVSTTISNLSDSIIAPYKIIINKDGRLPVGSTLIPCFNPSHSSDPAGIGFHETPRTVLVEWENVLSRKMYHAEVVLDKQTADWLTNPPFSTKDHRQDSSAPNIVVQWRGKDRVAVMLVADTYDHSKGKVDLGEATGKEIPKQDGAQKNNITYEDIQKGDDVQYFPGEVIKYERFLDDALSREQRFGCPRLQAGNVDKSKLPPEKLPFMYGANGEHIPCKEYFCSDKQAIIGDLKKLGDRYYKSVQEKPPYVFKFAPHPKPAW